MEIKPTYATFEQTKYFASKGLEMPKYGDHFYTYNGQIKQAPYKVQVLEDELPVIEQWQVVEWASLVHNIDLEARPVRYAGDVKTSYYQPYINGCIVNMSKFATRQEALSEAINEFLKMI